MKPTCGGIDPPTPALALAVTLTANAALAWSGQSLSGAAGALLAAIATWWLIWTLPPLAASGAVLVALLPIPAVGLAGLRTLDPPLWVGAVVIWSLLYAVAGGVCAALLRRWAPRLGPPVPWLLAWHGLDQWLLHAPPTPWRLPLAYGYPFVDTPLLGAAALVGPAGIGSAAALVALTAVAWLRVAAGGARRTAIGLTAATALLTALLGLVMRSAERAPLDEPRRVALTEIRESGLPEGEQWLRLLEGARALDADWHIWPEAALPLAVSADLVAVAGIAEELAAPLLAGGLRAGTGGERLNSAIFVDHHTVRWVYDKERLVPRFEDDLQPGGGERWPLVWRGWRIGVLICWESLFFDLALQRAQAGAQVLVVLADAGWAGESPSGPWHARVSRVLAVSLGVPVIFAAQAGPSRVWSHTGQPLPPLAPGSVGSVHSLAPPQAWRTPYRRLGVAGVALLWAGVGASLLALGRVPLPERMR